MLPGGYAPFVTWDIAARKLILNTSHRTDTRGPALLGSTAATSIPRQFSLREGRRPGLQTLHLLYHELRPLQSRYPYALETGSFKQHVDLFHHLRGTSTAGLRPEITFDDGHVSNLRYALPILNSRELKAHFFITAGWTGQRANYMSWTELRSLHAAGQRIGAHGWSHTLLTHCTSEALELELRGARLALEDGLGVPVTTMSLPGGRFNRRVLAACFDAGYLQVFTSIPKPEPTPPGSTVGRLNIRGDVTLPWITDLLAPGSARLRRIARTHRVKAAAQTLLGDRLYAAAWRLLNPEQPDTFAGHEPEHENSAPHQ